MRILVTSLLCTLLASGAWAAGGGTLIDSSSPAPAWKGKHRFEDKGLVWFVGFASTVKDKEEARQKALSQALNFVCTYVSVKVRSQSKDYGAVIAGHDEELYQTATIQTCNEITLSKYEEESYVETWQRNGREYDGYVAVGVSPAELAKLFLESLGLTRWTVAVEPSCADWEGLSQFVREAGSRKGWKMEAEPTVYGDGAWIKTTFDKPPTAYLLVVRASCTPAKKQGEAFKGSAHLAVDHSQLTERRTLNAFSAEGAGDGDDGPSALKSAQRACTEELGKKMFSYAGVLFSPQIPDLTAKGKLGDLDITLLELYERAIKADAEGWLFPRKAAEAWRALAEKDGANPYTQSASERSTVWATYESRRGQLQARMAEDQAKLERVATMTVVNTAEKGRLVREFLYGYAAIFGAEDIVGRFEAALPEKERDPVHAAIFNPQVLAEWAAACEHNDGAACYLLGLSAQGAARDKAFTKACEAQIGAACLTLARAMNGRGESAKGTQFADKACTFGKPLGCFIAGSGYYSGRDGMDVDYPQAHRLFAKACEASEVGGCAYLGWIYEHGEGVRADPSRSRDFYAKACELGHKKSCEHAHR